MLQQPSGSPLKGPRARLHEIIFESNTTEGKTFDIALLACIVASVFVVMMDSVPSIHAHYGRPLRIAEWVFTGLFTMEYILRIYTLAKPQKYIFSFLGVIDLLSILPMYVSLFYLGAESLLVVRVLRLMRVFRIFKLTPFLSEMSFLRVAIHNSLKKIAIFMLVVLTIVVILGSLMYLIEPNSNGFENIPDSIYWAIVTITTVGYGDISPVTPLGKIVASMIMLLGYGIIAVPTGILTTEMALEARRKNKITEVCPGCGREDHEAGANYCIKCGTHL
jgi:voltage-gated potassium channel